MCQTQCCLIDGYIVTGQQSKVPSIMIITLFIEEIKAQRDLVAGTKSTAGTRQRQMDIQFLPLRLQRRKLKTNI